MPGAEQRRFIRHPIAVPFEVRPAGGDAVEAVGFDAAAGTTRDIGQGGLLFPSAQSIPLGTELEVSIPSLKTHGWVSVPARVVRCEPNEVTRRYDIGVAFHNPEDTMRVRMLEQVLLIEAYRKQREIPDFNEAAREWIKKYSANFPAL